MPNLISKQNITAESRSEILDFEFNDLIRLTYDSGMVIEKVFSIMPTSQYKIELENKMIRLGEMEVGETIDEDDPRLIDYEANLLSRKNNWMQKV